MIWFFQEGWRYLGGAALLVVGVVGLFYWYLSRE